MTDVHTHTETSAHPDRQGGAAKRNDQAPEAERRSFGEEGAKAVAAAQGSASTGARAFNEARRALQEGGERGYWGPTLLGRQLEPWLRMQSDLLRWFDEAWRDGANAWSAPRLGMLNAAPLFGLPAADIRESEATYQLSVELPGLAREDVEVAVQGDALLISGHKQEQRQQGAAAYRLAERRYGRFERSFPLPADVRRDAIEAKFSDGVLSITLPRSGEKGPQRSRVQVKG